MTLGILDIFFVFMIILNFGFIVHLETQVKMLRSMMEEHCRYDNSLKDLQKTPIQDN